MARSTTSQNGKSTLAVLMDQQLFVLIFGVAALSMIIPALHGGASRSLETARAFLYTGIFGLVIFAMIVIAQAGRSPRHGAVGNLMSIFATFVFLPAYLALPFYESLQTTTFLNAYVEMVSALTTTGATLFAQPDRLNDTLHLWRAQVGWMGGLTMWIAALRTPLAAGVKVTSKVVLLAGDSVVLPSAPMVNSALWIPSFVTVRPVRSPLPSFRMVNVFKVGAPMEVASKEIVDVPSTSTSRT